MTVSKEYDSGYRLTRILAGSVADYKYTYDAAGNITSVSGMPEPVITAADAGNTPAAYTANHITNAAGKPYTYDGNGNILSDGIRTFAYSQDNRLIRVSMNNVVVGEYAYDAYGRRVKKVASGITTLYHYAGGNLIAETDGSGSTLRNYICLNGQPAAVRIYGTQDGMYYFLNDHLGTPQEILDSSAQVVWAAAYLPFGKAQVKPETVTNNLRFPGQYFDAESGLHYNWHRYYDPDTGRYITPDPIGLSGGINLYSYVSNNPANAFDPMGLDWIGYSGETLIFYKGDLGDRSKPKRKCKATSGFTNFQNELFQDKRDKGPIPEGDYRVNLVPDPSRIAKADPNTGDLIPSSQGGIERIPSSYTTRSGATYGYQEDWGDWRIRLFPKTGTDTYKRTSFYFHNSHKGYTHGCVETCDDLLNDLTEYRKVSDYIDVRVFYTDPTTNGGTRSP